MRRKIDDKTYFKRSDVVALKYDHIIDYLSGYETDYFDPIGKEDIQDKLTLIKQQVLDLYEYLETTYPSKTIETREKLKSLIPEYGEKTIKYFISADLDYLDFDKIVTCLPSKELLQKDIEYFEYMQHLALGYGSRVECPLSIKMIKDLVLYDSLDDYDDKLVYKHLVCYGSGPDMTYDEALFTKQEFIDSLEKQKIKIKK